MAPSRPISKTEVPEGKEQKQNKKLENFVKINEPYRHFVCKSCDLITAVPDTARVHYCDVKKVCCSKCDEKFKSEEEKEEHIKEVHFETITCNICGQRFVNTRNMKRHIDSVHANAVFPCDECDQICSRKDILETHRKRKHFKSNPL